MEYVLLLIILVVLIQLKTGLNTKITSLQKHIQILHEQLDALDKGNTIGVQDNTKPKSEKTISPKSSKVARPMPKVAPSRDPKINTKIAEAEVEKTAATTAKVSRTKPPRPAKPSLWVRFKTKNPDMETFIGENLINKFGILILVLGISYFVRFAIDKNWINEPARVGIGIVVGSLIIGIAHRMRKKYTAFGSVLVAGGIAVLYFTIAIAFHEYRLFGQTVAFMIMVGITAFSCLLSVSYNRIELAVLSLIGGFAVPFMIRTGSGDYRVLFTYIAILDIGILTLAYFKRWTLVHLLAFIFTTLLFGGWLVTEMNAEQPHYFGALFFGFLFYGIFILTNLINNMRTGGVFSKVQLGLLAVNTFVFFGIGMTILSDYHSEFKGVFTAVLALLNMGYAWFLYKKFGLDKTAVYLLIGLTLTFITLSIPIQFQGNYITLFWAAEAVLLMWLAQKSKIKWYRFASILVHLLMVFSLFVDWLDFYGDTEHLWLIFNPIFSTGIVAVVSLILVRYLLRNETTNIVFSFLKLNPLRYKKMVLTAAILIGYLVGLLEIVYQSNFYLDTYGAYSLSMSYHLLYTGLLCFFIYRKRAAILVLGIIALVNITLFTFVCSKLPFWELKENLILDQTNSLALYLHLISLLMIGYFFYLLHKTEFLRKLLIINTVRLDIWITAFLFIGLPILISNTFK